MPQWMEWLHENSFALLIITLGVTFLILLLMVILFYRFKKISKMYKNLMTGQEGNSKNLEELLFQNLENNENIIQKLKEQEVEINQLKNISLETIRHIGIVRYNAFDNVGSNQSFSVALLDHKGSGVILSSLYGREVSQVYAKPVKESRSSYPLTEEEEKAIQEAMSE
ncbi:DUF4446 family protein [Heliorestis convoluta]|uniref:DUF4446 family protein n=1 Tax=Heliorestis convoluta TaxID=356322 RepID=A0A5Q2MWR7_9FIRM|nr:DUF4446 family protein [Heliorestis convoluta]QGG47004.1 hypothetical protein FTV88_0847 [Heliorestis convoluta]